MDANDKTPNLYRISLPTGVYFFEGSPTQAMAWGRENHGRPCSVMRATIRYGRRLNLVDNQAQNMVVYVSQLLQSRGVKDVTFPVAVDALAKIGKIDTIVVPRRRSNARPLLTSRFEIGLEILLCVKSLPNILETELFLTELAA